MKYVDYIAIKCGGMYKKGIKNLPFGKIVMSIAIMLCVGCGCSYKGKQIDTLPESDSAAKIHFPLSEAISMDNISDREIASWLEKLSILQFEFGVDNFSIEASGTENGVIVKYQNDHISQSNNISQKIRHIISGEDDVIEIELNKGDWYIFLKSLFESGIREWNRKEYGVYCRTTDCLPIWRINIFIRDGDTLISSNGRDSIPPNWETPKNVIDDFVNKILNQVNITLEIEYEKKFGVPISDFERSVEWVSYKKLNIFKTMGGKINVAYVRDSLILFELDMNDWLDIIHTFGNNNCGSSNTIYTEEPIADSVRIMRSSREDRLAMEEAYWPAWDGLIKVMDGIRAKIKKDLIIENE